jgi:hypothetical protein
MKLTINKPGDEDWYLIERAEHDGRTWVETVMVGGHPCMSFMTAARFSDADVEGSAEEMRDIATAIETRSTESHKRCGVDATGDPVKFRSPRNSQRDGECTLVEADALAAQIRALLPNGAAPGDASKEGT